MKVIKFGGKSLGAGQPLANALEIIQDELKSDKIAVVVSARGDSTNLLLELYDLALKGTKYTEQLVHFFNYQHNGAVGLELDMLFDDLKGTLAAINNPEENRTHIRDKILAFGELISARIVVHLLREKGIPALFVDARKFLKVITNGKEPEINYALSQQLTAQYFHNLENDSVPIITGFIASDDQERTVTLGRNGSNFSTSLIANFIDASEVQNWTDINGIYTASPRYVPTASHISRLSYKEAHELANFGANILHPKTIGPLMAKNIPLKIFSSLSKVKEGTIIDRPGAGKGIKAVSAIENVALITIEGNGLLGNIGIDGRIFNVLGRHDVNVRLISQASSERGIGFVVDAENADRAREALIDEFDFELKERTINHIKANRDIAIIAIIGRHNYALEKAIKSLRHHKIWMHLISNSISGEHISLVVDNEKLAQAINLVYDSVFNRVKTINLFALGLGEAGKSLVDRILTTPNEQLQNRKLRINIVGVANAEKAIFNGAGIDSNWRQELLNSPCSTNFDDILQWLSTSDLENIVFADNTTL